MSIFIINRTSVIIYSSFYKPHISILLNSDNKTKYSALNPSYNFVKCTFCQHPRWHKELYALNFFSKTLISIEFTPYSEINIYAKNTLSEYCPGGSEIKCVPQLSLSLLSSITIGGIQKKKCEWGKTKLYFYLAIQLSNTYHLSINSLFIYLHKLTLNRH